MKFLTFMIASFIILPKVVSVLVISTSPRIDVNLTHWREQRRKKRFILFEDSGIHKIVAGISYPVDLGDKTDWRQLTIAYNLQYQFPVPPQPIYWWDKWHARDLANGPGNRRKSENLQHHKDEAQEFIYEFAENLMERWGMNGRSCVQRLICENAQIHINQGLYAEILHRLLQPQRNLKSFYTEAWRWGKRGVDCQAVYPEATKCLFDDYIHVRQDFRQQEFVKASGRM